MLPKMTLAEFLLARIAEDEAEAAEWPDDGPWGRYDAERMWLDSTGRPIYAPRARVLRDCEVKQGIVERCRLIIESFDSPTPFWAGVNRRERSHARTTLAWLASVYSDHPDYREEWKP